MSLMVSGKEGCRKPVLGSWFEHSQARGGDGKKEGEEGRKGREERGGEERIGEESSAHESRYLPYAACE